MKTILPVVILGATTYGCTMPIPAPQHMYEGAERPTSELATIVSAARTRPGHFGMVGTWVKKVDGKSVPLGFGLRTPIIIYVEPGKRELALNFLQFGHSLGGGIRRSSNSQVSVLYTDPDASLLR